MHTARYPKYNLARESKDTVAAMLLLYLIDWKAALELGRQISSFKWFAFSGYPYSHDAARKIASGEFQDIDKLLGVDLAKDELEIVNKIWNRWGNASRQELFNISTSTFPFAVQRESGILDLPALAMRYQSDFASEIKAFA